MFGSLVGFFVSFLSDIWQDFRQTQKILFFALLLRKMWQIYLFLQELNCFCNRWELQTKVLCQFLQLDQINKILILWIETIGISEDYYDKILTQFKQEFYLNLAVKNTSICMTQCALCKNSYNNSVTSKPLDRFP